MTMMFYRLLLLIILLPWCFLIRRRLCFERPVPDSPWSNDIWSNHKVSVATLLWLLVWILVSYLILRTEQAVDSLFAAIVCSVRISSGHLAPLFNSSDGSSRRPYMSLHCRLRDPESIFWMALDAYWSWSVWHIDIGWMTASRWKVWWMGRFVCHKFLFENAAIHGWGRTICRISLSISGGMNKFIYASSRGRVLCTPHSIFLMVIVLLLLEHHLGWLGCNFDFLWKTGFG